MPDPFFLVGPTAVGKSSLAVDIAARCHAEIVSADAFQVYRGLDLLSAKPSTRDMQRVPHHLIGMVPLTSEYNVARYLEDASRCLDDIASRGRTALIVGGSGLYVRALTHGLSPLPPTRPELREELERWDLSALTARLGDLDPAAMAVIDIKNKRRLVRAIEICEATGAPLAASRNLPTEPKGIVHGARGFFLTRDRLDLHARIHRRTQALVDGRVLKEIGQESDCKYSPTSSKIIGLNDLQAHLRGEVGIQSALEAIDTATRRYAKRQMTWFRNKSDFERVDLSMVNEEEFVFHAVATINEASLTSVSTAQHV